MPKGGSIIEYPIKSFLGLNLKDAGDRIKDNEFVKLQNVYQPTKGTFNMRWGTIQDQASFTLASRVSAVFRHYSATGDRMTLYHCEPDASLLPDNTVDLVLTEISSPTPSGNLFGGGSIVAIRVCYSWIGRGLEQTYNTKNRANFPSAGSFPLNASSNPAHQIITLLSSTSNLQVTIPAFPSGITGANIFISLNGLTQMTYMGTITTSAGSLVISEFVSASSGNVYVPNVNAGNLADPAYSQPGSGVKLNGGTLKPGNYFIGFAWVVDPVVQEGVPFPNNVPQPSFPTRVQFGGTAVGVCSPGTIVSNATSGSLIPGAYVAALTVTDAITGREEFVSTDFDGSVSGGESALLLTTPALPSYASPGSLFNLYLETTTSSGLNAQLGYFALAASSSFTILSSTDVVNPPPSVTTNDTFGPFIAVNVGANQNAINITAPPKFSKDGAQAVYVFIGSQDPSLQPMTCVGIVRCNTTSSINILSIPSTNAQSYPPITGSDIYPPEFWAGVNDSFVGGQNQAIGSRYQARFGFIQASKNGGALYECFPTRGLIPITMISSAVLQPLIYQGQPLTQTITPNKPVGLTGTCTNIRTTNDIYKAPADASWIQPYPWALTPNDPSVTYGSGLSYFANGVDIPWKCDGYTMTQMSPVGVSTTNQAEATVLPPIPRFIFFYQNELIFAGGQCTAQLYASNAEAAQNFAASGSGKLLRFVTPGDAAGSALTAVGIFTPGSDANVGGSGVTNNPSSFILSFKKVGVWMLNSIPDPTNSSLAGLLSGQVPSSMVQVSGHTGCIAPRSVISTPLGTLFLGSNANVYMINRTQEPQAFGTKVQNGMIHLVGNDAGMAAVTAVYHDNHYKISFPSPAAAIATPIVNDSEFWADLRTEEGDPIKWYGPHLGRNISAQTVLAADSDDLTRLAANGYSPNTIIPDSISSLSDLGTAIQQVMLSKIFRFNEDAHVKRILGAFIDCYLDDSYTNNLLFQGFADADYQQVNRQLSLGDAVWDVSQWDQTNYSDAAWQGFSFLFGSTNLNGRVFQFGIQKSDPAPWVLECVTLLMKSERRRVIF